MSLVETILLIVALGAAATVIYAIYHRRNLKERHRHLRTHFGEEYDEVAANVSSERQADRLLAERVNRVADFELRRLTPRETETFASRWNEIQLRFVETPQAAVRDAHRLVNEVMTASGYPADGMDERVEDVSVHHPHLVKHFRNAVRVFQAASASEATTEELRRATIHYRALFDALLEPPPVSKAAERLHVRPVEAAQ